MTDEMIAGMTAETIAETIAEMTAETVIRYKYGGCFCSLLIYLSGYLVLSSPATFSSRNE
ncbi:MAG: hypothetical protein SOY73_11660 [Blautia sp.]|nr:hypothetical protein [Blautia sp.]